MEPIIIIIYITDLEDNITSNVLKLSGDITMYQSIRCDEDKERFLKAINALVE